MDHVMYKEESEKKVPVDEKGEFQSAEELNSVWYFYHQQHKSSGAFIKHSCILGTDQHRTKQHSNEKGELAVLLSFCPDVQCKVKTSLSLYSLSRKLNIYLVFLEK